MLSCYSPAFRERECFLTTRHLDTNSRDGYFTLIYEKAIPTVEKAAEAAAWISKSKFKQEREGYSIPVQLKRVHEYAERHGFAIVADRDHGLGIHATFSGARRTTIFSAASTSRKKRIPSAAATRFVAQRFFGSSE